MGKLDVNKQKKRTSLLTTAFDLFTTQGINKTSISEIAGKAGVAKGTFYLYFKDKYDLRNKLISHKSSQLFGEAYAAMLKDTSIQSFNQKLLKIVDYIIDKLSKDKLLLSFISKNLSWGIFKAALTTPAEEDGDINFYEVYLKMLNEEPLNFKNPEVMLFLIIELVGSTCYSSILYEEPLPIEELKPDLYETIQAIIRNHTTSK